MMEDNFLPLDIEKLIEETGNIYYSVSIIGKRANQLTLDLKEELGNKLAEFAPAHDNLEEIIENREQIEISKFYERMPKPTQEAIREFMAGKIYYRNPHVPEGTSASDNNL